MEAPSRREAEVLELVGRQLSNREIAGRLYLSVRTVESHVAASGEEDDSRLGVIDRIGMLAPSGLLEQGPETARAFLTQAGEAGIDHVAAETTSVPPGGSSSALE